MRWRILSLKSKRNLLDQVLINRGLKTKRAREEFLNPPPPLKLTEKDLEIDKKEVDKAIKRIKQAASRKEKAIVYGDYDADGVCATAILWEALRNMGLDVLPFVPKREEGYGLQEEKIREFAEAEVKLIVTVDQGIVQYQAAKTAYKLGVDLVITDHHLPGKKKPLASAIIHTTKLCGAGVAWFLAQKLGDSDRSHLGLAAIGTVTDLMPLFGPNRALVKFGLEELKRDSRSGLVALFQLAGIDQSDLTSYEVGFVLGPRLNSSGRLADPLDSLRLLCTRDQKRAKLLAQKIDQNNRERQNLMTQAALHARELWLAGDGKESLIFIEHESYHEGVIGLAAGKLMEEFGRPAVVLARGEVFSKASARSIEGFNLVEAIRSCADLLGSHGGHPLAAGFTVETAKIEMLKTRLQALAAEKLPAGKSEKVLRIEAEARFNQLNRPVFEELQKLEPFGEGNRQPVLATTGVEVVEKRLLGANHQHLKLILREPQSKIVLEAIGFNLVVAFGSLSIGSIIDVAYNLTINDWNGSKKLQLKIKDIRCQK
ncbi:MAG: single-stranded-DNA-specific exonuclease RecJ [Candidatus Shapirobacteria bacterium]